jgi:hypothetical protein
MFDVTNIPLTEPRPEPVEVETECSHCQNTVTVELNHWKNMDRPEAERKFWERDTLETVGRMDRMCDSCQERVLAAEERAREYSSDVPPSWFDPTYAGETW